MIPDGMFVPLSMLPSVPMPGKIAAALLRYSDGPVRGIRRLTVMPARHGYICQHGGRYSFGEGECGVNGR